VGAGPLTDRAVALLTSSVEGQTKSITLVRNGQAEPVRTRAATVADLLNEQNIRRSSDDALDVDPSSTLVDGETISYRAAVPLTLVVDGVAQTIETSAQTVGEVLAHARVAFDCHDRLSPAAPTSVSAEDTISLEHVRSWVEKVQQPFAPPTLHQLSFKLGIGRVKVLRQGAPGEREISYLVTRQADRNAVPRRTIIASRVVRKPAPRIIAAGVGDYSSLAAFAEKGYNGTIRLAQAAVSMIATAYTANCYGCSGYTKLGNRAGHGIVAVDPAVIPLGSHLYIPGYGSAVAGDTGGAIRGNRVDLGFNSNADAMQFGRRSVTVYVLHP
jgi:3D (Asp-Asp-Asp) domain-containing protein/sulfur carrier protein ThiS